MVPESHRIDPPAAELADYHRTARGRTVHSILYSMLPGRGCRGRAEASDGRFLLGQVGQECGRITVAIPVGQVMGDQQGQGRVIGGRTA
jgi:hypothetical protein